MTDADISTPPVACYRSLRLDRETAAHSAFDRDQIAKVRRHARRNSRPPFKGAVVSRIDGVTTTAFAVCSFADRDELLARLTMRLRQGYDAAILLPEGRATLRHRFTIRPTRAELVGPPQPWTFLSVVAPNGDVIGGTSSIESALSMGVTYATLH